jgi:hypothetical protein
LTFPPPLEPVVDVSAWPPAGEEQRGDKPKQWLREGGGEDGTLWLWKESTWNTTPAGTYRKGDDWAEALARRLGEQLGLPMAEVHLAVRDGLPGVVSRTVLSDDESMLRGNVVLADADIDVHESGRRSRYTLDAVARALDKVAPTSGSGFTSAFEQFTGYLVLDAVIANTDRHEENWAVVEAEDGRRWLSPSFDHASSFGFQLSDEQRRAFLLGVPITVEQWARRARTKFVGRLHPVDLAADALGRVSGSVAERILSAVGQLDAEGEANALPVERWSAPARRFALAVVEANRARLLSDPFRTLSP